MKRTAIALAAIPFLALGMAACSSSDSADKTGTEEVVVEDQSGDTEEVVEEEVVEDGSDTDK